MTDHNDNQHEKETTPVKGVRPISLSLTSEKTVSAEAPLTLKPKRLASEVENKAVYLKPLDIPPPLVAPVSPVETNVRPVNLELAAHDEKDATDPTASIPLVMAGQLAFADDGQVVDATVPANTPPKPVHEVSAVKPVLRFRTFREAQEHARRTLPLPREMQIEGQSVNYQWLMAQLKVADTPERLHALAYRLNYKDLAVLFPTLATLSKRGPTEQIQTLIRARASLYLYYHGFITLQFAYPKNAVAKALSDLCIQLEDRLYAYGSGVPARFGHRHKPDINGRIVWSDVPLISEIAMPNSRHFLSDIAKAALDSSEPLDVFFARYAIYEDLPLGQAIVERMKEMEAGQTLDSPSLSKTFFERYRR